MGIICEFEFDDEKTGTGYFYYNNSELELTEETEPAETEPATEEATAEQEPETQRYYYNQNEAAERQEAILTGKEAEPIKLHPATGCIELDYFYNPDSAWWPVHRYGESSREQGEFRTLEDAEIEFYTNEEESIYCYTHDC